MGVIFGFIMGGLTLVFICQIAAAYWGPVPPWHIPAHVEAPARVTRTYAENITETTNRVVTIDWSPLPHAVGTIMIMVTAAAILVATTVVLWRMLGVLPRKTEPKTAALDIRPVTVEAHRRTLLPVQGKQKNLPAPSRRSLVEWANRKESK